MKKEKKLKKGQPYPFRPDADTAPLLEQLETKTGFNKAEIIRRSCRFAVPRFLDGTADILKAGDADDATLAAAAAGQLSLPMGNLHKEGGAE